MCFKNKSEKAFTSSNIYTIYPVVSGFEILIYLELDQLIQIM